MVDAIGGEVDAEGFVNDGGRKTAGRAVMAEEVDDVGLFFEVGFVGYIGNGGGGSGCGCVAEGG